MLSQRPVTAKIFLNLFIYLPVHVDKILMKDGMKFNPNFIIYTKGNTSAAPAARGVGARRGGVISRNARAARLAYGAAGASGDARTQTGATSATAPNAPTSRYPATKARGKILNLHN